jgi:2-furoate---CoA ligase
MLCAALLNGKLVCLPAYSPGEVLRLIATERVSSLFLVPTMYHDVLREPDLGRFDLGSLSRIGYAGMGMAPALIERCQAVLRPHLFVNYYGSSEIYSFTYCDHLDRKPASAGRAGLNQIVRVVPAAPGPVPEDGDLAPGEPGEIVASMTSPEAFAGYWKRPDADAKAIHGAWYRTGDLGHKDADGELYVIGRVDDMIISGGENIYPEEVEDALLRSGLCNGVAVVGQPDERLGSRVVAFIEPAAAADPAALDQACLQGGLARFKRPREYVFVRTIPRSASGKLLRRLLRDGEYERLR